MKKKEINLFIWGLRFYTAKPASNQVTQRSIFYMSEYDFVGGQYEYLSFVNKKWTLNTLVKTQKHPLL